MKQLRFAIFKYNIIYLQSVMVGCLAKIVTNHVGSVSIMNSVIILPGVAQMDVIQATVELIVQKVLSRQ